MLSRAAAPLTRLRAPRLRVRGFAAESTAPAAPAATPKKREAKDMVIPADLTTLSPVRGMFLGSMDSFAKHCAPFPKSLGAEEAETLNAMLEPVSDFFAKLPSAKIDEEHKIPDEVLAGLRELGLWGLQIPEQYGGLGLSNTAYARTVEEFVFDPSVAVTLMAHQSIGLKGILLCGNEAQKQKYLPPLASGEKIAAFALTEPSTGSDAASVTLTATPVDGGKAFVLNGEKMWISNGGICSTYTVFAKTPTGVGSETKMTAFIANREEHAGITPGPPEKKLGIRGSNTCVVTFDNVRIPAENVLGEVNGGFGVAMKILNNGRFGLGAATGGGIRKLISLAAEYANNRIQFGRPIASFGLIQEKFARMASDAYAIEAMAYTTTALIDGPALDMSVEAAIVKVYGSECMFSAINECIQILGGVGFAAGGAYPFERLLRDARILLIFEGTNEILRLFTALTCIQYTGTQLRGIQKNPLAALPQWRKMLSAFGPAPLRSVVGEGSTEVPKLAPAMSAEGERVGRALSRFHACLWTLLAKYGKGILEEQLQLKRVADVAIDLYGSLCVLSRASATVAAGSANTEHELALARLYLHGAMTRINANLAGMQASPEANGDALTLRVAKETLAAGKYIATHPLRLPRDVSA